MNSETKNWQIMGFWRGNVMFPQIVKVVLQKKDDFDYWFYEDKPEENIQQQIVNSVLDKERQQIMGARQFERLTVPIDYVVNRKYVLISFLPDQDNTIEIPGEVAKIGNATLISAMHSW